MADYSQNSEDDNKKQVLITEFNVSMHCNACERSVAKAISKIKGVEKFMTDMARHRVVVIGEINPEKVVKKIKNKTGKRVEILSCKEDKEEEVSDEENQYFQPQEKIIKGGLGSICCLENEVYTIFSDENPNACSIM